jgi:hypothetical protein
MNFTTDRRPSLIFLVVATLLVIRWLGQQISTEQFRNLIVAAVLMQAVWIFFKWRAGVLAFIVYVVLEGFIINYFHTVPELNLLKDMFAAVLFAVLLISLIMKGQGLALPRAAWIVPFIGFALIYSLQVFNPGLPNILVGLVGVRATLLFFILTPVAYWYFDSRESVTRFFEFMLWLSIPVAGFGILQSILGPGWVTSLSPGFGRAVFFAVGSKGLTSSSYFRTFSTFVHTGGFALFLCFSVLVCVALWLLPAWRDRRRVLAGVFVLQIWALFTTGARGAFLIVLLSVGILVVIQAGAHRLMPILLVIPLVMWASLYLIGTGVVERYETLLDAEFLAQRNAPLVQGWLADAMDSDWIGLGAGYASVASRHAGYTPLNVSVVENSLAKIRFEAGLPGLVFYVVFLGAMLWECITTPFRLRNPQLRWLVSVCCVYVFFNAILVVAGTPFDVSPTNTLIWFFLGLIAKAPQLDEAVPVAGTVRPAIAA